MLVLVVLNVRSQSLMPLRPNWNRFRKKQSNENDHDLVRSILLEGGEKARESARETLAEVRSAMGLSAWQ